jgi:GTP:adenosylcobinamide-phosphate guanylyltransferase
VSAEEVRRFGDPERLFMNVNTPGELALAEQYASTADRDDHRY